MHWHTGKSGCFSPSSWAASLCERLSTSQPTPSWRDLGGHLWGCPVVSFSPNGGLYPATQAKIKGSHGSWIHGWESLCVWSSWLAFPPLGWSVITSRPPQAQPRTCCSCEHQSFLSPGPLSLSPAWIYSDTETNGEKGGCCQSNKRIFFGNTLRLRLCLFLQLSFWQEWHFSKMELAEKLQDIISIFLYYPWF